MFRNFYCCHEGLFTHVLSRWTPVRSCLFKCWCDLWTVRYNNLVPAKSIKLLLRVWGVSVFLNNCFFQKWSASPSSSTFMWLIIALSSGSVKNSRVYTRKQISLERGSHLLFLGRNFSFLRSLCLCLRREKVIRRRLVTLDPLLQEILRHELV
jgi:hypothetical protein